jgi:hypothetical protein
MSSIDSINNEILNLRKSGTSVKNISDGNHTFADLYFQRMSLLSVICSCYPELSWKSKKHFDEENDPMYNDDFLAGINTSEGVVTYHIKLKYWDLFDIPEIERGPKYDGYNNNEALRRIISLTK